jgi:hypothetical protein
MQLQKQVNRFVNGKEYDKYVVVLPPRAVKEAGFKAGNKLKLMISTKGDGLIIRKK